MKKFAVIVAAGSGTRMGSQVPKQFLLLKDKPIIWHTLHTFLKAYEDLQIVLVISKDYLDDALAIVKTTLDANRIAITVGGDTRFESVKNGLKLVSDDSIVFVHDGVRCLVTQTLIHRCYEGAVANGNAIPAVKPVDSIRVETHYGNSVLDRDKIHIIQTPQTFKSSILKAAFEQPYDEAFTDEASVAEKMGEKIYLVEGETSNIKITQPLDMLIAEKILA